MSGPVRCASQACRIVKGSDPPSQPHGRHGQDEEREPGPSVLHACEHMILFCRRLVTNTMIPGARMNSTNQENEMKWMDRAACRNVWFQN